MREAARESEARRVVLRAHRVRELSQAARKHGPSARSSTVPHLARAPITNKGRGGVLEVHIPETVKGCSASTDGRLAGET